MSTLINEWCRLHGFVHVDTGGNCTALWKGSDDLEIGLMLTDGEVHAPERAEDPVLACFYIHGLQVEGMTQHFKSWHQFADNYDTSK